jgi:hypothetical protein
MRHLRITLSLISFISLVPQVAADFADIPNNHPDATAIYFLQSQQIVSGSEDGLFHPERSLTRCELTKVALLVAKITPINVASSSFSDVPVSNWCSSYANTARAHSILQGYPDGTFRPQQAVTEIEGLKILINSLNVQLPSVTINLYDDVRSTDWWAPYIMYVRNFQLSDIPSGSTYDISNVLYRNKMARIIYRGLQTKQTGKPFFYQ